MNTLNTKQFLSVFTALFFTILLSAPLTGNAQDDKFGDNPDKCRECISLYREYYKQKNYDDALPGWRCAIDICPKGTKNIYLNGITLVKHMMKSAEKGSDRWIGLRDTLMMVYDMRIEHFGQEGFVLGKKGSDQYKMFDDPKVAYETLKKALKLLGNDLDANSCANLFLSSMKLVIKKEIERDEVFDLYDQLMPIVQHNLANEKSVKYYTQALNIINSNFEKVADCASYIELSKPKVAAAPQDTVLLRKVVKFMTKRNCTTDPFYLEASELLHKIEPSADAAYGLYEGYIKKKEYKTALKYIKEAADLAQDNETKADYIFRIANLQYHAKQYTAARANCNKAAELKPGWGAPFVQIADMYYSTSASCGTNNCEKTYGYFAATDMYNKAKRIDPEAATNANKGLAKCRAAYPSNEDCFFYNIKEGETVTVGGWIGVSTTVRLKK